MKRSKVLWIAACLLFVGIFNAIFFIAGGTEHITSVWISYGFIHFACLMLLCTNSLTPKSKNRAVLGFPLYIVSSIYLIVELVVGVVYILAAPYNYTGALLIQLVIAALYGVIFIVNMIANEHTAGTEAERQYEIMFIKTASSKLKSIMGGISDDADRRKIERIYDAVRSSPAKSNPDLYQAEKDIMYAIEKIESALSRGEADRISILADSLLSAVNERNQKLRLR